MRITLDRNVIDTAMPKVRSGLEKYLWLQAERDSRDLAVDDEYRRRFNGFYRVRRDRAWQGKFYALLEVQKRHPRSFADVLAALQRSTGRYEASFASKLVATADPMMPVIDRVVLENLGARLPSWSSSDRAARIVELHAGLTRTFRDFLDTNLGRHLVKRFRGEFPGTPVTDVKMLDLVLWQTR